MPTFSTYDAFEAAMPDMAKTKVEFVSVDHMGAVFKGVDDPSLTLTVRNDNLSHEFKATARISWFEHYSDIYLTKGSEEILNQNY